MVLKLEKESIFGYRISQPPSHNRGRDQKAGWIKQERKGREEKIKKQSEFVKDFILRSRTPWC